MNEQKPKLSIDAEDVERYLDANRDFFTTRDSLLAKLELNHHQGAAVSLAERQIKILRQEKSSIVGQIEELVANAKRHDAMMQRIHQVLLEMVQLKDIEQVKSWMSNACTDQFGADFVTVNVANIDPEAANLPLLSSLGVSENAICVEEEQVSEVNALFALSEAMNSFAILPLCNLRPFGYIVLGSKEKDRYQPQLGTLYLQMLADCCAAVLSPLLADIGCEQPGPTTTE